MEGGPPPFDARRAKRARLILEAMREAPASIGELMRAARCPRETRKSARNHTRGTIAILQRAGCLVRRDVGVWLITPAGLRALMEYDAFTAAPATPARPLPIEALAA